VNQAETPPPHQEDEPAGQERQSTPFLVLQFFVFPMAIVASCVAVFVVFGLIAAEGKSAREYLAEVRSGGTARRWQAAFELSKVIQAKKDAALRDPRFVDELLALFQEAEKDDPRVRRYLALALGRVGDARAVAPLLKLVSERDAATDSETLIYSIWALGALRDEAAVPELVRLAGSEDPGVRKAAVHALGALPGAAARERLLVSLADPAEDVRWNAALGLARRGDAAGAPVLKRMLDRAYLARVPGLSAEQAEEAMLGAVAAAGQLHDAELRGVLGELRKNDPSLKLRNAAGAALEARSPAP
jgi:HEAT repeat protein